MEYELNRYYKFKEKLNDKYKKWKILLLQRNIIYYVIYSIPSKNDINELKFISTICNLHITQYSKNNKWSNNNPQVIPIPISRFLEHRKILSQYYDIIIEFDSSRSTDLSYNSFNYYSEKYYTKKYTKIIMKNYSKNMLSVIFSYL